MVDRSFRQTGRFTEVFLWDCKNRHPCLPIHGCQAGTGFAGGGALHQVGRWSGAGFTPGGGKMYICTNAAWGVIFECMSGMPFAAMLQCGLPCKSLRPGVGHPVPQWLQRVVRTWWA